MSNEEKQFDREKQLSPFLDIEDILPILSKISIFAGLSTKQLDTLFRLLEKAHYKAGENVFNEGEKPSHIYIVQSGSVKLVVNAKQTPLELIVFEEGQCFGETSMIGIQPHAASAISVGDTELIVLSREALLSVFKIDLELFSILILNIAREACRRLHKTDEILMHYVLRK
ncbi:MAG: cyclic nucleotide-binding domain-containing protein [Planctomycetes bacterium]|nr:cyclic nucleotide-binding domain-containing protein [Planctomycetota bacterium]